MQHRSFVLASVIAAASFGCSHDALSPTLQAPVARLALRFDKDGVNTGGLIGFTQIEFNAGNSSGDIVSYTIDFGDGVTSNAASAVHACEKRGLLTSRLTVVDRFNRSDSTMIPYSCEGLVHAQGVAYSLTYGWISGTDDLRRLAFESQVGPVASGFYLRNGAYSHFTGLLSGDRSIKIVLDDGSETLDGEVMLRDRYTYFPLDSRYVLVVDRHLFATPHGTDSASGVRLDFAFYDPF